MKMHYDRSADVLYLRLSQNKIESTKNLAPGVNVDFDRAGELVGIEVLDVSERAKTEGPEAVAFELLLGEPR